jgi:hypothetical protein
MPAPDPELARRLKEDPKMADAARECQAVLGDLGGGIQGGS